MNLRQRLNPRLHVAAAIGWAVFGVVTLAALVAANLAAAEAEHRARADAEGLLVEFATQVRDALSMNLNTRRSLLLATAAQIAASNDGSSSAVRRSLGAVQTQFPEFSWLAVVDGTGHLITDTAGRLPGEDMSTMPWFQPGRKQPYVSDLHAPLSAEKTPPRLPDGQALRLMDFAVPLGPSVGYEGGVIAAHVSWAWVERVLSKIQEALNKRRQVEVMLAGRDGTVLVGPAHFLGRQLAPDLDITESGDYVVGTRTQLRLADGLGLGWTAIVRQSADVALAPVRTTRRTVFLIVFIAGLLSAAAAATVTRILTRRLSLLATEAEAVRRGERRTLATPAGVDEVSRIGATLAQVVDHLQTEKQALQTLNAELDSRVAERSSRIERLADQSRHAAVTRERLRMARDLHDTLAHSLMALLTQIRLVRKLHSRMDPDELDAEMGRAEGVAATGLSEARAAIMQMRDNGVRETGLAPAMQDLVRRFGQRTGVAVTMQADPQSATWADDRSETVFRIAEEALRNVERHAQSTAVRVTLRCSEPFGDSTEDLEPSRRLRAFIEVADDGIGFDPALPQIGHYGLRGMQEQAALIAARLGVHSRPGQGTRVVLEYDV